MDGQCCPPANPKHHVQHCGLLLGIKHTQARIHHYLRPLAVFQATCRIAVIQRRGRRLVLHRPVHENQLCARRHARVSVGSKFLDEDDNDNHQDAHGEDRARERPRAECPDAVPGHVSSTDGTVGFQHGEGGERGDEDDPDASFDGAAKSKGTHAKSG